MVQVFGAGHKLRGYGYQSELNDAGGSGLFGDLDTPRESVSAIKARYAGQPEPNGQREDEIVPTKRKVAEGSILANVTKMQYFNS